jgi:hypothetical protein
VDEFGSKGIIAYEYNLYPQPQTIVIPLRSELSFLKYPVGCNTVFELEVGKVLQLRRARERIRGVDIWWDRVSYSICQNQQQNQSDKCSDELKDVS